jgi:hypothetical protein
MPTTPAPRTRRRLGVAAVVTGVAALLCAVVAGGLARRGDAADASITPATLASTPSTIAPRTSAPRAVPATPSLPVPTTTLPPSPLGALVGDAVSAMPVAPPVDIAPTAVAIPDEGLEPVPVRPVGIAPDGQLEVPDETEVGWYRLGAAPGQPGATVLAAHVSWRDSPGPFVRLSEVEPGAFVDLALADGTSRRYQVVERAQYGKLMLPQAAIWRTTGPETLVLITCGGAFNPDIRRYADNIVVTAVPVA